MRAESPALFGRTRANEFRPICRPPLILIDASGKMCTFPSWTSLAELPGGLLITLRNVDLVELGNSGNAICMPSFDASKVVRNLCEKHSGRVSFRVCPVKRDV